MFRQVALVAFVSAFPIIYNSWTGVKAVKEIWLRSAQAMSADDRRLFRHVIVPGALPYIVTGERACNVHFYEKNDFRPLATASWNGADVVFMGRLFRPR